MPTLSFKPKKITKKITSHLAERAADVVMNRFGLSADGKRKTLEEIGKKYGITRERVRQVEDSAINLIKKSDAYKAEQAASRLAAAELTEKELKWSSWEGIK